MHLVRINKIMHVKYIAWYMAHSKCSVNVSCYYYIGFLACFPLLISRVGISLVIKYYLKNIWNDCINFNI